MSKEIIWFDMDGVLADFGSAIPKWHEENPEISHIYKHHADRIPGIFRFLEPIDGAIDAVHKLHESGLYHMYVATSVPWGNPEASTDKRYWISRYFGKIFHKKITMTHQKNLLVGDYLIDDRTANGAGDFMGKHIHFGYEQFPNWDKVLDYLLNK